VIDSHIKVMRQLSSSLLTLILGEWNVDMFGVFDTSDTCTADRPAGEPIVAQHNYTTAVPCDE